MKSLRLLLLLSLAACDVQRPVDSYTRDASTLDEGDASGDADEDSSDDEGEDAGPSGEQGSRTPVPRPDEGDEEPDAGAGSDDEAHPLAALAGRYLMRVDMYSTNALPLGISIKNRVSDVMLVDFTVRDGKLLGIETFCAETYAHTCSGGGTSRSGSSCTMKTEVLAAVKQRVAQKPVQTTREYTFDKANGVLTGQTAAMALGFDEDGKTKSVPADQGDGRVWKLSGSSGFATKFEIQHPLLAASCTVDSVVRMKSRLSGKLDKAEPTLDEGVAFTFEDMGTEIGVLGATGRPTTQCSVDALSQQDEPSSVRYVTRFKRLDDDVDACPSDFDAQLPAEPPG